MTNHSKAKMTHASKHFSCGIAALLMCSSAASVMAGTQTIDYANWSSDSPGQVNGTLLGGTVNVTYTGEVTFDQLNNTGTYFYTDQSQVAGSGSEYTSNPVIANTPSTSDMIAITGSPSYTDTFTFSKPVVDPVMLLVSLGNGNALTTYNFNQPVTVLSDGPGWWGGPGTLLQSGNSVTGVEGDGAIEFVGTYSSISFTGSTPEYWNGFTLGVVANQSVPDPASSAWLLGSAVIGLGLLKRKLS